MRNANQMLSLLLIGLGVAALSVLPSGGSIREVLELQAGMFDMTRSSAAGRQPSLLMEYGWAIRAGGWFATVIGVGGVVIPWINALVYRRYSVVEIID